MGAGGGQGALEEISRGYEDSVTIGRTQEQLNGRWPRGCQEVLEAGERKQLWKKPRGDKWGWRREGVDHNGI